MDKQITFNTSMFGFQKKAVLKYIDQLGEENQNAMAALKEQIAEMEKNSGELSETVGGLNGEVTGLQQKLTSQTERARGLQRAIDDLSAEIERQQGIIDEKNEELKQYQSKCKTLEMRAESLEYKGKKYDEVMYRIGGTFVHASQSADEIIKAAEKKASRMTAETIESIQHLAQQVGTFKGDVGVLRGALQKALSELERRLDGIDRSISQLDSEVKAIELIDMDQTPAEQEPIQPHVQNAWTGEDLLTAEQAPESLPEEEQAEPQFLLPHAPAENEPKQVKRPRKTNETKPAEFYW